MSRNSMFRKLVFTAALEDDRRILEEEEMTHYSSADLEDDWEFKIVRSPMGTFRDPEIFSELLEEEARYGWVLLEKLDDSRVRFKRPRSARSRDYSYEGEDPYRSFYGRSPQRITRILSFILIGMIIITLGLILLMRNFL